MGSDALQTSHETATAPCPRGYGLQPSAHAAVAAYAAAVAALLEGAPSDTPPEGVREALQALLETPDLLQPTHRRPGDKRYRRHVLYADPDHRFTVLALVWSPGHTTSIHGHTAWGVVGVYEGEPNVCCYDCHADEAERLVPKQASDERFGPGATCAVRAGLDDVHRIYNATEGKIITIHTYGRDLVEDPESINVELVASGTRGQDE